MPPIDWFLIAGGFVCAVIGAALSVNWRPYRYRVKSLDNGRYLAQYRYRFLPMWFDVRRGVTDRSVMDAVVRCDIHKGVRL